jgi:hypothetical protein
LATLAWLTQHPTYKAYFGVGRVFAEKSQAEAVRSVVFQKQQKIVAAHNAQKRSIIKEEED